MSTKIGWNLQLKVNEGRLEEARTLMGEMVNATREEMGAELYEWYLSEDGGTCHINEAYSDSAAVMTHLGNFGTHFAERFLGCFSPLSLSVYGDPSDEARKALDGLGANYLGWFGGFSR